MERLTIGELAKQSQVNLETIRYYERLGLIPEPARSSSGYRAFGAESVGQIRFIKHAQALGFSLKEVKELLNLRTDPHSTGGDVRKRAKAKITDIEEKIKALEAIKDELAQLVAACDGTSSITDCPILKSLGS